MQEQLEEARAAVTHEREAAKIAIEQAPPVIKEVPVVDNTKLEQLTNENQELKVKYINLPHVWCYMSQNHLHTKTYIIKHNREAYDLVTVV